MGFLMAIQLTIGLALNIELECDRVSRFNSHFIGVTGDNTWDNTIKKIQTVDSFTGKKSGFVLFCSFNK